MPFKGACRAAQITIPSPLAPKGSGLFLFQHKQPCHGRPTNDLHPTLAKCLCHLPDSKLSPLLPADLVKLDI